MYFSRMFLVNGKTIEITQKLLKNGNSSNTTTRIHKYFQRDDQLVNIWKRQNGSSTFFNIFKIMWFEFLKCQVLFWLFRNKSCKYYYSVLLWILPCRYLMPFFSLPHAFSLSKNSRWRRSPLCRARPQTLFMYSAQTLRLCLNSQIIQHTKSKSVDWTRQCWRPTPTQYMVQQVCFREVSLIPQTKYSHLAHSLNLSQGMIHWFRDVSVQWGEFITKQGPFGEHLEISFGLVSSRRNLACAH